MASNQLSEQDRNAIINGVDSLFGRVVKHLPCPLRTMDERRDLVWCMLDEDQLNALKVLTAGFASPTDVFTARGGLKVYVDDLPLHITRKDSTDEDGFFWGTDYGLSEQTTVRKNVMARRVPKWQEMLHWIELTTDLSNQLVVADQTFDELLAMCKTAGQIRRVLPELVDFMPANVKRILSQQARASSTPFQWSAFDRSRVDQLTDMMAKCMLMTTEDNIRWCNRDEYTWPVVTTLRPARD